MSAQLPPMFACGAVVLEGWSSDAYLGLFEALAPTGSVTLFAPLPTRLFPGTMRGT